MEQSPDVSKPLAKGAFVRRLCPLRLCLTVEGLRRFSVTPSVDSWAPSRQGSLTLFIELCGLLPTTTELEMFILILLVDVVLGASCISTFPSIVAIICGTSDPVAVFAGATASDETTTTAPAESASSEVPSALLSPSSENGEESFRRKNYYYTSCILFPV